ncbi:utilization protein for catechol-siderophore [Idiomarina xiamenensis 10-D-4]|uniref:Utilization protein for catechol-siderophore n=2 Tax=Idiomarina xiamenensis TaxID=1207041 RepID=K2KJY0_9GAMM|nr:utilization protein for catechol-siderophore [Idiomarina xiamenensis 10-D-4]
MRRIHCRYQGHSLIAADAGGYVKLLFNQQGGTDISTMLANGDRPIMRTYTLRTVDPEQQQLSIDLVRHTPFAGPAGPALRWLNSVMPGDQLQIAGPGHSQYPTYQAQQRYWLIADMTALPALSVLLAQLPKDARGDCLIQVHSEADIQSLNAPAGIDIRWLVSATADSQQQAKMAQQLPAPNAHSNIWVATEFDAMRAIRRYLTQQLGLDRQAMYISSYWRAGRTEEGHKVDKREDMAELS